MKVSVDFEKLTDLQWASILNTLEALRNVKWVCVCGTLVYVYNTEEECKAAYLNDSLPSELGIEPKFKCAGELEEVLGKFEELFELVDNEEKIRLINLYMAHDTPHLINDHATWIQLK